VEFSLSPALIKFSTIPKRILLNKHKSI